MKTKSFLKKLTAVFFAVIIIALNTSVGAAEEVSRLKSCLENDHMYYVESVYHLGSWIKANKKSFSANYEGMYVVVTGQVWASSVSGDRKTVIIYEKDRGIEVDTSEASLPSIVGQAEEGDNLTVYGRISSTSIKADHIVINSEKTFGPYDCVFYPDKVFDEEEVTDLTNDRHIAFRLPALWKSSYCMSRLTNNDSNGYQFFLNAISPQNLKYPENFYIFYFGYETYLDHPPKSPTKGDRHDIEELVINNILADLAGNFDISISEITLSNGKTLDYCPVVYRPKDGNDYRLEFLFRPDSGGLLCMLYLYYPNDSAVNHIREVAYLIQTLEEKAN